jgi:UDP-2-acetamido-3-amino-2,3-dideoxy-glucuronate N-acetyltransferase
LTSPRPDDGSRGKQVAASADVDESAAVGEGTFVWDLAQIRENAVVGTDCVLGRGAYLGAGAKIGDRVKVQNFALVYEPALLEDGVFIGPGAILTNDTYPRAVEPDGRRKSVGDWRPAGVTVLEGASVGARAVCVAPLTIGRWAMVGAGATVVEDVSDFALVVGVPARQIGWVGRSGRRLVSSEPGLWRCPETGTEYLESDGLLSEVQEDESGADPSRIS